MDEASQSLGNGHFLVPLPHQGLSLFSSGPCANQAPGKAARLQRASVSLLQNDMLFKVSKSFNKLVLTSLVQTRSWGQQTPVDMKLPKTKSHPEGAPNQWGRQT